MTQLTSSGVRTIRRRVQHEIAKRKGSRFIAAAWPLNAEPQCSDGADGVQAQVKALIDHQRDAYPSACHHCYAFTTVDGREYCSDDGEPHGTAGRPILVALQRAQLVDVCLVVTRIFGGTKLGTGGLIRAYGAAAQELLEQAEIIDCVPTTTLQIVASFAHIEIVKLGCAKFNADILEQQYARDASFVVRVPLHHEAEFTDMLRSRSSGGIAVTSFERV
ncbi:hypothetical protein PINS_up013755 [Pythium insidiosum]|nr:hypothetical protein PINS_up013755 [Pythium insidiosum]